MKLQILSDLHLEFNPGFVVPDLGADVLVLAGDIAETRNKALLPFLQEMSARFKYVIYVLGNHEHYKGYFPLKVPLDVPRNVYVLDNQDVHLDGYHFIGTTLWTNLADPVSAGVAERCMNDYHCITYYNKQGLYRKLRAKDTTAKFNDSVAYLNKVITKDSIVVTHHAPLHKSISPKYKGDLLNVAFHSDLSSLILDKKPKMWIHGHTHNYSSYVFGDTLIMANPIGYPGEHTGACLQQVLELRKEMQRIYDKDSLVVYVKDVLDKLDKIIDDGQRKST